MLQITSTMISAAIGYGASILPRAISLAQDWSDKRHELKILEMQLKFPQAAEAQSHIELESIEAFKDLPNVLQSGDRKWDTFTTTVQSMVRPTITLLLFALYAIFKLFINPIWSDIDTDIFTSVIFFWFGGRQVRK